MFLACNQAVHSQASRIPHVRIATDSMYVYLLTHYKRPESLDQPSLVYLQAYSQLIVCLCHTSIIQIVSVTSRASGR